MARVAPEYGYIGQQAGICEWLVCLGPVGLQKCCQQPSNVASLASKRIALAAVRILDYEGCFGRNSILITFRFLTFLSGGHRDLNKCTPDTQFKECQQQGAVWLGEEHTAGSQAATNQFSLLAGHTPSGKPTFPLVHKVRTTIPTPLSSKSNRKGVDQFPDIWQNSVCASCFWKQLQCHQANQKKILSQELSQQKHLGIECFYLKKKCVTYICICHAFT